MPVIGNASGGAHPRKQHVPKPPGEAFRARRGVGPVCPARNAAGCHKRPAKPASVSAPQGPASPATVSQGPAPGFDASGKPLPVSWMSQDQEQGHVHVEVSLKGAPAGTTARVTSSGPSGSDRNVNAAGELRYCQSPPSTLLGLAVTRQTMRQGFGRACYEGCAQRGVRSAPLRQRRPPIGFIT